MGITCVTAHINGNIYYYQTHLCTQDFKEDQSIRIKKYFSHSDFLNKDFSLTIKSPCMTFHTPVNNIHIEGTVSLIFDVCPIFHIG